MYARDVEISKSSIATCVFALAALRQIRASRKDMAEPPLRLAETSLGEPGLTQEKARLADEAAGQSAVMDYTAT